MRSLHPIAAALGVLGTSAVAATLTVNVEHIFAGEPLRFEQRHTLADGRTVAITRLDYLITEFALLTADGRALRPEGQAAFISVGQKRTSFSLPGVPAGEYVGVAFRIGVPAEWQRRDAASWPAGHALNPAVSGLHWGWQGGYIFTALEGRYGEQGGFSFHIARDENLMTVRVEKAWRCDGDTTLALRFDVARALGDAGLKPEDGSNSTHSAAGDAVATLLKRNIERAWSLQGAQSSGADTTVFVAPGKLPDGAVAYEFRIPNGFPPPELPADNPLSVAGMALGQRLFSDKRLSINGTQSCASCHLLERAFTEPLAVSVGAEGKTTPRNAPGLLNLAWHRDFARDGRRTSLRAQALAPLADEREMHQSLEKAAAAISDLAPDFASAFGSEGITAERVGLALEQFLLTRTSAASKFDRVLLGKAKLSAEEQRGFDLFHMEFDPARGTLGADCFHCHGGFDFSDHAFHDIGLGGADAGRFAATGSETDRGKMKTPSLRNVARTAPYMHDGRFATLEEVIAHYDHSAKRTPNLDPNLAKHPVGGMKLSTADQQALVAFLQTLSDEPAQ